MSYKIEEALHDSMERHGRLQELHKLYPDAEQRTLPDGASIWCSKRVVPQKFLLAPWSSMKDSRFRGVMLCAYAEVMGIRVFVLPETWPEASEALGRFRLVYPDFYKLLLTLISPST